MILFHGTFIEFQTIELGKCRPYKDFGKGFYLTDIEEQAMMMAEKKSRIFNGSPIILKYDFNEQLLTNGELKVMRFSKPNQQWAEFIYKNRSRSSDFHHDYDIVTGPIADDGVAYLLDRYEEGTQTSQPHMSEETRRQFLINYAVDKLTSFLIEDRHISLEHALDIIYSSRVYDLLQDKAADLTADSPAYIYELLKDELAA